MLNKVLTVLKLNIFQIVPINLIFQQQQSKLVEIIFKKLILFSINKTAVRIWAEFEQIVKTWIYKAVDFISTVKLL